MRTLFFVAIWFSAQFSLAQGEFKPSYPKLQKALRQKDIAEAKRHIDALMLDPKEQAKAKGWFFKGEVYQIIALSNEAAVSELDPNALPKTLEAYNKVKELTEKNKQNEYRLRLEIPMRNPENEEEILNPVIPALYEGVFNKGAKFYSDQDYNKAAQFFEAAMGLQEKDTTAAFMLSTSGYSLKNKELLEKGMKFYYERGGKTPDIFLMGFNLAIEADDQAAALQIVEKGLAKFPKAINLLKTKAQILGQQGKYKESIEILEKVNQLSPDDENVVLFIAKMYDDQKEYDNAIKFYKKALEMNKKNFDANLFLGLLYYKLAAEAETKWNDLRDASADKTALTEAEGKIKQHCMDAMPYLETCYRLQPEGDQVNQVNMMLVSVYRNLGFKDKQEAAQKRVKK
jgi:tetratricopeptide (TPR) repeat protein